MSARIKNAIAVAIVMVAFVFVVVSLVWLTAVNSWPFFVPFVVVISGIATAAMVAWAFARLAQ